MKTYGPYVGESVKYVGLAEILGIEDDFNVGTFDSVGSGVTCLSDGCMEGVSVINFADGCVEGEVVGVSVGNGVMLHFVCAKL